MALAKGSSPGSKKARSARNEPAFAAREERRFEPTRSSSSWATAGVGGLGAALLGAGVYAQWARDPALTYGPYLVGAGALLTAVMLFWGLSSPLALLVGDAGVGQETSGEQPVRIAWCDVERVAMAGNRLLVTGKGTTVEAPLQAHTQAASWIVKEALERIPGKVVIDTEAQARLPKADLEAGQVRVLEEPQVAGKRCKSSGKLISFEQDARLCPRCGEIYHKDHVPQACITCGAELT